MRAPDSQGEEVQTQEAVGTSHEHLALDVRSLLRPRRALRRRAVLLPAFARHVTTAATGDAVLVGVQALEHGRFGLRALCPEDAAELYEPRWRQQKQGARLLASKRVVSEWGVLFGGTQPGVDEHDWRLPHAHMVAGWPQLPPQFGAEGQGKARGGGCWDGNIRLPEWPNHGRDDAALRRRHRPDSLSEKLLHLMSDAAIRTLRLAFFGESGSGKTSLVSSYFGYQQRHAFEQSHGYRLSAVDTREGSLLLKNYYGMQDGVFPMPTVSRSSTFHFDLKVSRLSRPALRLEWIDYPGGWWGHAPADAEEQQRQSACIKSLLNAQVGFLIVDGELYQREGTSYLRRLLLSFAREVQRWQKGLIPLDGSAHLTVIEEWVIALAKADRFPSDYTAERFGMDVIKNAVDELIELATALYGQPRRFGTRFMLLSAAQAEPHNPQRVLRIDKTIGLELIAPAALLLPLNDVASERANHNPRLDLPLWQRLLITLGELAKGKDLKEAVGQRYKTLVDLIQVIGNLAQFDVEQRSVELKKEREKAVQEGDALMATALVMKQQLSDESAQRVFFVSQDDG